MKRYLTQMKGDLKPALDNLPSPETFELMYGDGFMEGDLSNVPVKTLAEWLGIDLATLPPSDMLTKKQHIDMAKTLLSYWDAGDELVQIIRCVLPKRQYESAIEYMQTKGRYDGRGGFELVIPPLTPEELRNIRSPADDLDWGLPLIEGEDNGLPF
ncbi:MAG: hypothetical protein U5L45_05690 [Saprospiraceae bacterium]|nr:hypothetical protein [Saprospiraceae bacterium]